MLRGLLAELLFGVIGVKIPTYVGNDNSTAAYQVDPSNKVTGGKLLTGFLESNREELGGDGWRSVGYSLGNLNTSDGLTKAMSSAGLRGLLNGNKFRIVNALRKAEIRKRLPAPKHYIGYPETIQDQMDLNVDMRRKTRARGEVHIGEQF